MNKFKSSHYKLHLSIIVLFLFVNINTIFCQDTGHDGGEGDFNRDGNTYPCSNYNMNKSCGGDNGQGQPTMSSLSVNAPGYNIAGINYDPIHNSSSFTTPGGGGGRSLSGIGPLNIRPVMVYRSFAPFSHDEYEGAQFHANFDVRLHLIPKEEILNGAYFDDVIAYRDEWGNVTWLIDTGTDSAEFGSTKKVFRSVDKGNDDLASESGVFFAIVYDPTEPQIPFEMRTQFGGVRKFNASGWLISDTDKNGNTIQYVRDSENYVTKIIFPTDDPTSNKREAWITYSTYDGISNHKRLTKIELYSYSDDGDASNDGVFEYYDYYYNGNSVPFILNRVTGKTENDDLFVDVSYNWNALTPETLPTNEHYRAWINSATSYRITSIKDNISNQIITKFGYDGDASDPYNNFPNEIKRIGYEDANGNDVWLLDRPQHDVGGWDSNRGVITFPNNGKIVFDSDNLTTNLKKIFYEEFEEAPSTETWNVDGVEYNVSKKIDFDYSPDQENNLYTSTTFYSQFSDDYYSDPTGPPKKSYSIHYDFFFDYSDSETPDMIFNGENVNFDMESTKHFMAGPKVTDIIIDNHHTTNLVSRFEYDVNKYNSPLTKAIVDEGGLNITSSFIYDATGNLLTATNPLNEDVSYTYNQRGQLETATSPMGKMAFLEYNPYGEVNKITDSEGRSVQMTYNPTNSDLLSVLDPMGNEFEFSYGSLHRVTEVRGPADEILMSATYDDVNQTYTYTDGDEKQTHIDFNLKDASNPSTLTYIDAYGTASERITSVSLTDAFDVDKIVYPDGSFTTSTYDKMHRVRSSSIAKGADSITYSVRQDSAGLIRESSAIYEDSNYTNHTETTYYTYNDDMSFNSYIDWEGNTTSLTYDKLMRVTNVTRSAISSSGNQNYAVQTYTYNNGSQITTNEFGTSNKPADFASAVYAYNPDGQLVLIRLSNDVYTLYHYSDDGSLTRIEHMHDADGITYNETSNQFVGNDGTPLSRLSYSYDDNGQIISRARQFFDNGVHQRTAWREFTYDKLGRLVGESYEQNDVSDLSKNQIRLYNYDLAGNRTSMRSQAGITNYTYDELHQLTDDGSSTYQYDLVGSLIAQNSSTNRSLTYDVAGNLVQVVNGSDTINYTYDDSGSGHLQTLTFNGTTTTYFWEGYSLSLEKENGSAVRAYFNHPWEVGSTICRFDLSDGLINSNDDAWFYLHDEAGNVILITDKDGNPVIEYEQDVWGNDLEGNFGDYPYITQHQTGKLWDAEAGLYYNSARWYDPEAGRFISVSPLSPFAEEEYAFCHNNPVNFVDVNGLVGEGVADKIDERGKQLEQLGGDLVNRSWDPNNAESAIGMINTGAQCTLEFATPMPGDEVLVAGLAIYRLSGYLRNLKIIRNFFPNAYDIAKAGGRHAGKLDDFLTYTPNQLRKAIRSFDNIILIHKNKINNPGNYIPNWNKLSLKEQKGIIKHWKKEIVSFSEQRSIAEEILRQ